MRRRATRCNYLKGLGAASRLFGIVVTVSVVHFETLLAQPIDDLVNNIVPANIENPVPAALASLEAGGALFSRACATCHGLDARGSEFETEIANPGPNPPSLIDAQWDYGSTDGEIWFC
jgi:hypothetical protein